MPNLHLVKKFLAIIKYMFNTQTQKKLESCAQLKLILITHTYNIFKFICSILCLSFQFSFIYNRIHIYARTQTHTLTRSSHSNSEKKEQFFLSKRKIFNNII